MNVDYSQRAELANWPAIAVGSAPQRDLRRLAAVADTAIAEDLLGIRTARRRALPWHHSVWVGCLRRPQAAWERDGENIQGRRADGYAEHRAPTPSSGSPVDSEHAWALSEVMARTCDDLSSAEALA